ncbi:MAG: ferredoxin family protein [Spirochaetes bacterium]|nr:ferredoxin family protein [Spirochaetota bacterium]
MRKQQTKYIKINTHKCKACWDCIEECKKGVLGKINLWFHKHIVIKNADECCGCQKCIAVCPNGVFEPVVQINAVVNK